MYKPRSFATDDVAAMHRLIRAHGFGTLVTPHADGVEISHIPMFLEVEADAPYGVLLGHVAKANPHWRQFEAGASFAIFCGPHGYISPGWYAERLTVPTWNYAVVHAHGRPDLVVERAPLKALVTRLAEIYEAPLGHPWDMEAAAEAIDAELGGIVGFRMPIERLDGKFKLSQNRSVADRAGVIAALEKSNPELAGMMRETFPDDAVKADNGLLSEG